MQKIIKTIFLVFWFVLFTIGIIENASSYEFLDWCAIILIALSPLAIIHLIHIRRVKRSALARKNIPATVNSPPPTQLALNLSVTTVMEEQRPPSIEQGYLAALERQNRSLNPSFHRSLMDNELSFEFISEYGAISSKKADEFLDLDKKAFQVTALDEKIQLLNDAIFKFYEVRDWHYNKSKGGMLYFQDIWENMHNSRDDCFSWVDGVKEYLDDCKFKRDYLIPEILSLAQKEGGIVQKDIYPHLEASKSTVQKTIRELDEQNIIIRVKKGNSYLITKSVHHPQEVTMQALLSQIAQLGKAHGALRIVLFGSRARGDCHNRSDIDLAVYGLPLCQLGALRFALEELPTLLKFDLVPIDQHTDPALLAEINRDGVIIYEADEN